MPRGIDHLVLTVRDLDAAAAFYRRLGFQVGARNRHPWGTANHIVQFQGCFLELIGVEEQAKIPPHLGRSFSFGAFVRDALERGEGLAMLVLDSADAVADARSFEQAGIGDFEPVSFSRLATRPDGSSAHVAFTLAFAVDRLAPEVGFFVCQQHYPENFWNPAFQTHDNGTRGIAAVTMVAENPSAHAEFLYHFTGEHDLVANSSGIAVETARGTIEVLTSPAWRYRTGLPTPDEPARLAGFQVGVSDLAALADRLRAEAIPFSLHAGAVVLPPKAAFGTALSFVAGSAPEKTDFRA
jgi:catechol 2,3-dioxygenase-like lactoylglutathione lyase family enzyme